MSFVLSALEKPQRERDLRDTAKEFGLRFADVRAVARAIGVTRWKDGKDWVWSQP